MSTPEDNFHNNDVLYNSSLTTTDYNDEQNIIQRQRQVAKVKTCTQAIWWIHTGAQCNYRFTTVLHGKEGRFIFHLMHIEPTLTHTHTSAWFWDHSRSSGAPVLMYRAKIASYFCQLYQTMARVIQYMLFVYECVAISTQNICDCVCVCVFIEVRWL